ncbi:MAG: hypothetical protein AAF205_06890, partial [Pseudomonadota bacterium]
MACNQRAQIGICEGAVKVAVKAGTPDRPVLTIADIAPCRFQSWQSGQKKLERPDCTILSIVKPQSR